MKICDWFFIKQYEFYCTKYFELLKINDSFLETVDSYSQFVLLISTKWLSKDIVNIKGAVTKSNRHEQWSDKIEFFFKD